MTTLVDIANQALQPLGTRTTITSLGESSNEAQQFSIAEAPVQSWCHGLANWNFARTTAALAVNKGPPPTSPPAWSSTYPAPPWLYEYALPTDFVRAVYLTNSDAAVSGPGYLGEPKRFVLASGASAQVLLTNEASAVLVYTAFISDPTLWPWYFERLTVTALALILCMPLTGDKKLYEELALTLEQQVNIAIQANASEGLINPDSTPEWIQALGINYPYRRIEGIGQSFPQRRPTPQQQPQGGDQ